MCAVQISNKLVHCHRSSTLLSNINIVLNMRFLDLFIFLVVKWNCTISVSERMVFGLVSWFTTNTTCMSKSNKLNGKDINREKINAFQVFLNAFFCSWRIFRERQYLNFIKIEFDGSMHFHKAFFIEIDSKVPLNFLERKCR